MNRDAQDKQAIAAKVAQAQAEAQQAQETQQQQENTQAQADQAQAQDQTQQETQQPSAQTNPTQLQTVQMQAALQQAQQPQASLQQAPQPSLAQQPVQELQGARPREPRPQAGQHQAQQLPVTQAQAEQQRAVQPRVPQQHDLQLPTPQHLVQPIPNDQQQILQEQAVSAPVRSTIPQPTPTHPQPLPLQPMATQLYSPLPPQTHQQSQPNNNLIEFFTQQMQLMQITMDKKQEELSKTIQEMKEQNQTLQMQLSAAQRSSTPPHFPSAPIQAMPAVSLPFPTAPIQPLRGPSSLQSTTTPIQSTDAFQSNLAEPTAFRTLYTPSETSLGGVTLTNQPAAPPVLPAVGGTEKIHIPDPGCFNGRTGEDAQKWFKAMDRYHSCKRISNEQAAATSFASRLDKNALMWFDRLPTHIQMSYTELRNAFYANYIANMDQDVGFADLSKMKLKTSNDWDDLVLRHGQICDQLQIHQPQVRISTFKNILPTSIMGLVKGMKFATVEECAKTSRYIYESESQKLRVNAIYEHPSEQNNGFNQNTTSSWRGGRGRSSYRGRGGSRGGRMQRPKEDIICYCCDSTGHFAKYCPDNARNRQKRAMEQAKADSSMEQSLNA